MVDESVKNAFSGNTVMATDLWREAAEKAHSDKNNDGVWRQAAGATSDADGIQGGGYGTIDSPPPGWHKTFIPPDERKAKEYAQAQKTAEDSPEYKPIFALPELSRKAIEMGPDGVAFLDKYLPQHDEGARRVAEYVRGLKSPTDTPNMFLAANGGFGVYGVDAPPIDTVFISTQTGSQYRSVKNLPKGKYQAINYFNEEPIGDVIVGDDGMRIYNASDEKGGFLSALANRGLGATKQSFGALGWFSGAVAHALGGEETGRWLRDKSNELADEGELDRIDASVFHAPRAIISKTGEYNLGAKDLIGLGVEFAPYLVETLVASKVLGGAGGYAGKNLATRGSRKIKTPDGKSREVQGFISPDAAKTFKGYSSATGAYGTEIALVSGNVAGEVHRRRLEMGDSEEEALEKADAAAIWGGIFGFVTGRMGHGARKGEMPGSGVWRPGIRAPATREAVQESVQESGEYLIEINFTGDPFSARHFSESALAGAIGGGMTGGGIGGINFAKAGIWDLRSPQRIARARELAREAAKELSDGNPQREKEILTGLMAEQNMVLARGFGYLGFGWGKAGEIGRAMLLNKSGALMMQEYVDKAAMAHAVGANNLWRYGDTPADKNALFENPLIKKRYDDKKQDIELALAAAREARLAGYHGFDRLTEYLANDKNQGGAAKKFLKNASVFSGRTPLERVNQGVSFIKDVTQGLTANIEANMLEQADSVIKQLVETGKIQLPPGLDGVIQKGQEEKAEAPAKDDNAAEQTSDEPAKPEQKSAPAEDDSKTTDGDKSTKTETADEGKAAEKPPKDESSPGDDAKDTPPADDKTQETESKDDVGLAKEYAALAQKAIKKANRDSATAKKLTKQAEKDPALFDKAEAAVKASQKSAAEAEEATKLAVEYADRATAAATKENATEAKTPPKQEDDTSSADDDKTQKNPPEKDKKADAETADDGEKKDDKNDEDDAAKKKEQAQQRKAQRKRRAATVNSVVEKVGAGEEVSNGIVKENATIKIDTGDGNVISRDGFVYSHPSSPDVKMFVARWVGFIDSQWIAGKWDGEDSVVKNDGNNALTNTEKAAVDYVYSRILTANRANDKNKPMSKSRVKLPVNKRLLKAGLPSTEYNETDIEIDDVVVSPGKFQQRQNTDKDEEGGQGIKKTGGLENQTVYDASQAGDFIFFVSNEGVMFLVDGHQRMGLARRMLENDPTIRLKGTVLYAEDGWTEELSFVKGAWNNLNIEPDSWWDAAMFQKRVYQAMEDPQAVVMMMTLIDSVNEGKGYDRTSIHAMEVGSAIAKLENLAWVEVENNLSIFQSKGLGARLKMIAEQTANMDMEPENKGKLQRALIANLAERAHNGENVNLNTVREQIAHIKKLFAKKGYEEHANLLGGIGNSTWLLEADLISEIKDDLISDMKSTKTTFSKAAQKAVQDIIATTGGDVSAEGVDVAKNAYEAMVIWLDDNLRETKSSPVRDKIRDLVKDVVNEYGLKFKNLPKAKRNEIRADNVKAAMGFINEYYTKEQNENAPEEGESVAETPVPEEKSGSLALSVGNASDAVAGVQAAAMVAEKVYYLSDGSIMVGGLPNSSRPGDNNYGKLRGKLRRAGRGEEDAIVDLTSETGLSVLHVGMTNDPQMTFAEMRRMGVGMRDFRHAKSFFGALANLAEVEIDDVVEGMLYNGERIRISDASERGVRKALHRLNQAIGGKQRKPLKIKNEQYEDNPRVVGFMDLDGQTISLFDVANRIVMGDAGVLAGVLTHENAHAFLAEVIRGGAKDMWSKMSVSANDGIKQAMKYWLKDEGLLKSANDSVEAERRRLRDEGKPDLTEKEIEALRREELFAYAIERYVKQEYEKARDIVIKGRLMPGGMFVRRIFRAMSRASDGIKHWLGDNPLVARYAFDYLKSGMAAADKQNKPGNTPSAESGRRNPLSSFFGGRHSVDDDGKGFLRQQPRSLVDDEEEVMRRFRKSLPNIDPHKNAILTDGEGRPLLTENDEDPLINKKKDDKNQGRFAMVGLENSRKNRQIWGLADKAMNMYLEAAGLDKIKPDGMRGYESFAQKAEDVLDAMSASKPEDPPKVSQQVIDKIWAETGFVLGKDMKLRYEVKDLSLRESVEKTGAKFGKLNKKGKSKMIPLGDIVKDGMLFRRVPQLRDMKVRLAELSGDGLGKLTGHEESDGSWQTVIEITTEMMKDGAVKIEDKVYSFESVLAHEIQHAVQHITNLAGGDNTYMDYKFDDVDDADKKEVDVKDAMGILRRFHGKKKINFQEDAGNFLVVAGVSDGGSDRFRDWGESIQMMDEFDSVDELDDDMRDGVLTTIKEAAVALEYWEAHGEAEAREVQNRMGKSAKWRRENPPSWDGIPLKVLILPGGKNRLIDAQDRHVRFALAGEKLAGEKGRRLLSQANAMKQEGKSTGDIWEQTGWILGDDNVWRFEIDDLHLRDDWRELVIADKWITMGDIMKKPAPIFDLFDGFDKLPVEFVIVIVPDDHPDMDKDILFRGGTVLLSEGKNAIRMQIYVKDKVARASDTAVAVEDDKSGATGETSRSKPSNAGGDAGMEFSATAGLQAGGVGAIRPGQRSGSVFITGKTPRPDVFARGGWFGGVDVKGGGSEKAAGILGDVGKDTIAMSFAHEVQHFVQSASNTPGGGLNINSTAFLHVVKRIGIDKVAARMQNDLTSAKHNPRKGIIEKFVRDYEEAKDDDSREDVLADYMSFRRYMHLSGEAEARDVATRYGKSAEWRAANPPDWDGIPENDRMMDDDYPVSEVKWFDGGGRFAVAGAFSRAVRDGGFGRGVYVSDGRVENGAGASYLVRGLGNLGDGAVRVLGGQNSAARMVLDTPVGRRIVLPSSGDIGAVLDALTTEVARAGAESDDGNVRQWFMDFAGAIPRLSRVAAADFARDGMPGDDIGIDARLAGNDDLVLFDWDAAPADWQQKDLTKAAADLGFPQLPVGAGTLAKIWRAGRDAGVPSDKFADIVRTAGYDGWQIPAIGKDNTSRRMVLVNDRAVSRVGRFAMMNAYHGTGATRQAPKDNGLRFAIAPPKGTPEWWLRKGKWQDDERLKGTKARKIVYHGSPNTFTHFDPKKKGDHTDSASAYMGYFFSDNEEVAASYSGQSGLENAIYSVGSLWNDMIRRDEMPDDLYLDKEAEKMYYNAQTASQGFLDTDVREIPGLVDALNFIINAEWTSDESKRDARSDLDYLEQIQRDGEIPMNHPVRLALKNPLIHDYGFQPWRDETFAELLAKAKKEGRDGAIFRNVQDMMIANHTATPHYSDIHIAFSPEQIISAKNGKTMKKRRKAKPKDTGGRFSVGDVFDDRDGFRQAGGDSFVGRRFAIVGESLAGEYGRRRLNRARNMRKDGASVGDIWRETGWVRGKDDKWRFEMDDVRLSDDWLRHFSRGDEQVKLSSLVENKDALELLPGARNALVSIDVLGDSTLKDGDVELVMAGVGDFGVRMVYYVGGQDVIGEWRRYVAGRVGTGPLPDRDGRQQGRKNRAGKGGVSGSDGVDNAKRSGIERERQVLAHEVQHFVQAASGLSGGVVLEPPSKYEKEYQRLGKDEVLRLLMDLRRHKSDYVLLKGAKYGRLYLQANNDAERKQALLEFLAFRHYALNLGEAEAREVQNRFGKSAEWRAANPPNWDGIAEKDLILPTGDGRYSIAPGEFRRSVGGRFDVSLRDGRAVVFDRVSNLQGGFGLRDGDALPQVVRAAKGQKVRLRAAMLRSADKIGAVLDDFSRSAAAMRGGFDIDGNIADIRKGFTGNNKRQILALAADEGLALTAVARRALDVSGFVFLRELAGIYDGGGDETFAAAAASPSENGRKMAADFMRRAGIDGYQYKDGVAVINPKAVSEGRFATMDAYSGTTADIRNPQEFLKHVGSGVGNNFHGYGLYLTESENIAEEYAQLAEDSKREGIGRYVDTDGVVRLYRTQKQPDARGVVYHYVLDSTLDNERQKFNFLDWGKKLTEKQEGQMLRYFDSLSPGKIPPGLRSAIEEGLSDERNDKKSFGDIFEPLFRAESKENIPLWTDFFVGAGFDGWRYVPKSFRKGNSGKRNYVIVNPKIIKSATAGEGRFAIAPGVSVKEIRKTKTEAVYSATNKDGRELGDMRVVLDTGAVSAVQLRYDIKKRKGYGSAIYLAVAKDFYDKHGIALNTSGWAREDEASMLWQSLMLQGFAKRIGQTKYTGKNQYEMIPERVNAYFARSAGRFAMPPDKETLDADGKYDVKRDGREFVSIGGKSVFYHATDKRFADFVAGEDTLVWFADNEDEAVVGAMGARDTEKDIIVPVRLIGNVFDSFANPAHRKIFDKWAGKSKGKDVRDVADGRGPHFSDAYPWLSHRFHSWLQQNHPEFDIIRWVGSNPFEDQEEEFYYSVSEAGVGTIVNAETGYTMWGIAPPKEGGLRFAMPPDKSELNKNGQWNVNKSKFRGEFMTGNDDKPLVVYHATMGEFDDFDIAHTKFGLVWFALSEESADDAADGVADWEHSMSMGGEDERNQLGKAPRIIKAYLRGNIFDALENKAHSKIYQQWVGKTEEPREAARRRYVIQNKPAAPDYQDANPEIYTQLPFHVWLAKHHPEFDIIRWLDTTGEGESYTVIKPENIVNAETGYTMAADAKPKDDGFRLRPESKQSGFKFAVAPPKETMGDDGEYNAAQDSFFDGVVPDMLDPKTKKPLTLLIGSPEGKVVIKEGFDPEKRGSHTGTMGAEHGIFATDNLPTAKSYSTYYSKLGYRSGGEPSLIQQAHQLEYDNDVLRRGWEIADAHKRKDGLWEGSYSMGDARGNKKIKAPRRYRTEDDAFAGIVALMDETRAANEKEIERLKAAFAEQVKKASPNGLVIEVHIALKNPIRFDGYHLNSRGNVEGLALWEMIKQGKDGGHDGVIITDAFDTFAPFKSIPEMKESGEYDKYVGTVYIAFDEGQIVNARNGERLVKDGEGQGGLL